jgi:hypothetical protein
MKKKILVLMLGFLLIAVNLYAAGDLIVEGDVGIRTTTPGAPLDVVGRIWQTGTGQSVFLGEGAGNSDDLTNNYNVFVGYGAGYSNTTGYQNFGLGWNALYSNNGNQNSGLGSYALYSNTTGLKNSAVGSACLLANTTGNENSAIGFNALRFNTTGSYNLSLGNISLYRPNASNTVAIGYAAGFGVLGASHQNNVVIGYKSGYSLNTGSNNLFLGYQSGYSLATGSNNIVIGYNTNLPTTDSSSTISIGNLIYATGLTNFASPSSSVSAGNVGIGTTTPAYKLDVAGTVNASGGYTQVSDIKFKKDITAIESPLNKILNIKGVSYSFKTDEYKDRGFSEGTHYGVIGQEIEKVLPEVVKENPDGDKSVSYTEIIPVLIEAVKEQQKVIEELKAKIKELEGRGLIAKSQL